MLKPSPLKHKGDHGMYASEEEYHKANGGEVEEVTDNIVKPLDLNPTLPPILSTEEKDKEAWKNNPKNPLNVKKEELENDGVLQNNKLTKQARSITNGDATSDPIVSQEVNPLLLKLESFDAPEKKKELRVVRNDEIKDVFGSWGEDGEGETFEKGEYSKKKDEVGKVVTGFGGIAQAIHAKETRDRNEGGSTSRQGGVKRDADDLDLVGDNLDDAAIAKDVKWDVLDQSLVNASMVDFAKANKIELSEVDKNSKEFKEFAKNYTRESLTKNKDLYKRVIDEDYTEIASEIDNTKKKTEFIQDHFNKDQQSKVWSSDERGFGLYSTKTADQINEVTGAMIDDYQPTLEGIIKNAEEMGGEIKTLSKTINEDHKWLNENDPAVELKRLMSKEYTTQEEADAANEEYATIIDKYNGVLNRMNGNIGSASAYRTSLNNGLEVAHGIEQKVGNLSIINDLSGDYYGELYNISSRAVAATSEFIGGIDKFTEYMNPFHILDPDNVPTLFKPALEFAQNRSLLNTNPLSAAGQVLFDADEDFMKDGLDNFAKALRGKQTTYEGADWGTRTIMDMAEMFPQIAIGMTGVGTLGSLGSMVVSSAGNNFVRFEEDQVVDGVKVEGMKGWELYSTAMFHGAMEGISEHVTSKFGSRALMGYGANKAVKRGFMGYAKNMLGVGAYTSEEAVIEGVSEGINTWSTNMWDKYVNGKKVNLWDGVNESFWKGASVSIGFKGPSLVKATFSPFLGKSTNTKLGQIADQIREFEQVLTLPATRKNKKKEEAVKKKIASLINESNNIYDKAITTTASIDEKERKELIDIEVESYDIKNEHSDIASNQEMDDKQKEKELKALEQKYSGLQKNKEGILNKYGTTSDKDRMKAWNNTVESVKRSAKLAEKKGAKPIAIKQMNTQQFQDYLNTQDSAEITEKDAVLDAELAGFQSIIDNPASTKKQVAKAKKDKSSMIKTQRQEISAITALNKGDSSNYGVMIPQEDANGNITSYDLVLNTETSLKDGMVQTAAHEFLHVAFYNTLKQDPAAQRALGTELVDMVANDKNVTFTKKGRAIYDRRMAQQKGAWGEESFAILSELMQGGDATIKEKGIDKVKGVIRRFTQNHLGGADIKFDTQQDVKNFIIDYNKSIKNNKPSKAIAGMIANGAKGNLIDIPKDPVERQNQKAFSTAIDLNLKADPDLMDTFDAFTKNEDGGPKYTSQADFEASPDYYNAYLEIVEGKKLDGLIRQGMTAQGVPAEALKEFTAKVKEGIGKRFLPSVNKKTGEVTPGYRVSNDSLFGWLTGVAGGAGKSIIYRAKGDVMVQYTKDAKADITSLDKRIGEAGTLADVLEAEKSAEMEAFENEDLSVGRKKAYIEGPVPTLDQLELPQTKQKVDEVVSKVQKNQDTRVDLDGLKYKGVKKLLVDAVKITRIDKKTGKVIIDNKTGKPKLFNPSKVSDVKPTGALYSVLDAVAKQIGVDPKRIIANQDLDGPMRKAAKQFLYSKIVNEDGTFNKTLLEDVLPEGETRSGEATGIANTKLGLLYNKGNRAVFAEGATAAGKETQTKRTDVTMEEMLDVVGINPDGTFQSGTTSDGAIRQVVLSIAQLAGNQGLRQNALKNGTHSEAVVAQLGDGRAERAFSQRDQGGVEANWPELIDAVAGTDLSATQLKNAAERVYGKGNPLVPKVVKQLKADLKGFVPFTPDVASALKSVNMNVAESTLTQHLAESFANRQTELVLKNKLGFSGSVTDVFNDPTNIGQTKQRVLLADTAESLVNDLGVVEAGKLMIGHISGGFASNGAVGNGQLFVPNKPGGTLVPGISTKTVKGVEVNRSNRQGYQSTNGMADFVGLANNANIDPSLKQNGKWIRKSGAKGFTHEVYDGSKWIPINTKLLKENVTEGLKDRNYEAREKQSMDARRASKIMLDIAWAKVQDPKNPFNKKDFAATMTQLGAGMESPLRKSANLSGIQKGVEAVIARGKKAGKRMADIVRYEHATSKQEINARIVDSYNESGTLNDNVWDGYTVNIISGTLDNIMNAVGYKTQAPADGSSRMYNPRVLRHVFENMDNINLDDIGVIESINPKDKGTANEFLEQDYIDAINTFKDVRNADHTNMQIIGQAVTSGRLFSQADPQGISVLDFDDTLATSNSLVISTSPDVQAKIQEEADRLSRLTYQDYTDIGGATAPNTDIAGYRTAESTYNEDTSEYERKKRSWERDYAEKKEMREKKSEEYLQAYKDGNAEAKREIEIDASAVRKLTAEQFATEGADLLDMGWKHDFSEFNKVVDGKVASLFNKALKLQEKFGNDNMFVLTARPPESASSIFEFLKANGLNIPLKNITGLANSTAESKANWIAEKVGEGYNDFYFADDAMQNVKAVQEMLDQFDVKSKVQQAKRQFSQKLSPEFNTILEQTTGMKSEKVFSDAQAKIRGQKTKYKSIIPASAQDFKGLLYNFIGKGKKGEADMAFFQKALIDPFARGISELNTSRQNSANDYKNIKKAFPEVAKIINKKVDGLEFTNDQAARVYLWNSAGFDVPGLSQRDLKALVEHVEANPQLQAFAEAIGKISQKEAGYSKPGDFWLAENITSDLLSDGSIGDARADVMAEWQANVDVMFSPENLNKIEAIYGGNFREALEDSLYRMRTGKNRPAGGGRIMNTYMNWVNNSVGAIMFFNMRSAILQTISATNYINWSFNNPAKAAIAFANQPQFWKDFSMLFNSPYLKQRRSGNQRGINEAELSAAVAGTENKAKAAIAWLLKKGFLPTQLADSFAIASGGATFFRNKVKALVKEGMTQEQAEKQAFLAFQETTEVSQQSARPDMISQQQASPLGRLILSFQNTPMQYARIMNKAARDLANGRGDTKTHLSKIAYYGVAQSILFGALQSALMASMGDDEEDDFDKKKERILNGMIDSVLSGIGYGGKAVSTIKNSIREYIKQKDKGWNADHTYTILSLLSFSPPIGSKLRKIYGSIQTEQFNQGVFKKRGLTLDNPAWSGIGNVVEGVTNVPLGRIAQKMLNIDNAMDDNNSFFERAALLLGWNTWDLGIKDKDIEAVKDEIKEEKKVETKKKQKIKKQEKKKEKEEANVAVIEENKKKSKKDGICSAISKGGNRCKTKVVEGDSFCTVHEKATPNSTGVKSQCKKIKDGNKRCKMQTSSKSGFCYYHD